MYSSLNASKTCKNERKYKKTLIENSLKYTFHLSVRKASTFGDEIWLFQVKFSLSEKLALWTCLSFNESPDKDIQLRSKYTIYSQCSILQDPLQKRVALRSSLVLHALPGCARSPPSCFFWRLFLAPTLRRSEMVRTGVIMLRLFIMLRIINLLITSDAIICSYWYYFHARRKVWVNKFCLRCHVRYGVIIMFCKIFMVIRGIVYDIISFTQITRENIVFFVKYICEFVIFNVII